MFSSVYSFQKQILSLGIFITQLSLYYSCNGGILRIAMKKISTLISEKSSIAPDIVHNYSVCKKCFSSNLKYLLIGYFQNVFEGAFDTMNLWAWSSPETCCPVKLWILCPWISSELSWRYSHQTQLNGALSNFLSLDLFWDYQSKSRNK